MSWSPPIPCSGRRYPNAPAPARCGCLERAPGYWLCPLFSGLTGPWSGQNGQFLPFRYRQYNPPGTQWDPRNEWTWIQPSDGLNTGLIETAIIGGVWTLSVYLTRSLFAGNFGRVWRREFADGFPKWPNSYDLTFHHDNGAWAWGGNSPLSVFIPEYSQIAPNSCIV
jgi:hypothetical protein